MESPRQRWQRRAGRAAPFILSGVVVTLLSAWVLPTLLVMRGIAVTQAPIAIWHRAPTDGEWVDAGPRLEVRRGAFADWYIAEPPNGPAGAGAPKWPDRDLEDSLGASRSVPSGVVAAPPDGEAAAWHRIDTGLTGWPFRAFASEAWFPIDATGARALVPDFRWNFHVGLVDGDHVLVPLRPRPFALLLDIAFWATVCWCLVAGPREWRRRRRTKYGRCVECGYAIGRFDVKRPERCPECGAPFTPDPLGFAHAPEMHYQNAYVWLIFVSSLDIMLTWKILEGGGVEVNPVAALIIDHWGMQGAIAFKFALMMWVIVVCEVLARKRASAGRFLSVLAVVVSASPVAWSLFLLIAHELLPGMGG